jgi:hypothetical protein
MSPSGNHQKYYLFLAIAFWVWLNGCSWLELPAEVGAVIFQDDFSRSSSGWDRYQGQDFSADYYQDQYRIIVQQPETLAWATPHLNLKEARIEVLVTKVGGSDDNIFGVLCGLKQAQSFYTFLISSDGFSGIGIYQDGEHRLLNHEVLLPSSQIHRGNETNQIRADCVGKELSLYVNGHRMAQVEVETSVEGDVGVLAGASELPGVEIHFDNFSVLQP